MSELPGHRAGARSRAHSAEYSMRNPPANLPAKRAWLLGGAAMPRRAERRGMLASLVGHAASGLGVARAAARDERRRAEVGGDHQKDPGDRRHDPYQRVDQPEGEAEQEADERNRAEHAAK